MRKTALFPSAMSLAFAAASASQSGVLVEKAVGSGFGKSARSTDSRLPYGFTPANINRHTGHPHEHKREIARRQRQAARA